MTRRDCLAALLIGPSPLLRRQVSQSEDFTALSIIDAATRIASGELSPVRLVEAYLQRIQRVDPDLHAFITVTIDRARRDVRVNSGPLRGIPIAHKDLFETAGILTTGGSKLFGSHVPAADAVAVQRLTRAGAVLVGKTNTDELGGGVTTINPFYGPSRNPVDRTRVAGGSSGGSAVAVAARLCAAATGSDTGGSIRIPAAFCGVVGYIPTFGRIPTAGVLGACPTFDRVGLLARSVADCALLAGVMTGDHTRRGRLAASDSSRPRIGVARPFFFDGVATDVERAVANAIDRYRRLGAEIVERPLPVDRLTMARVFDPIVASEIWSRYGNDWRMRPELFSPDFATFFAVPPPSPAAISAARRALNEFQQAMDEAHAAVDAVITPTVPITAPRIEGPIDAPTILRNTWPFNAARTPAISVPCGTGADGLPVGLQLTARRGHDATLVRVAGLIG